MKHTILIKILSLICITSFAQEINTCGTDILMQKRMNKEPLLMEKRKLIDHQSPSKSTAVSSYTIPIVFHILHQNGPENISDSQVRDGLRILNEDFSKNNLDIDQIIPSFNSVATL